MLTLGLEPMYFVSEEYCHYALTRSATSGCGSVRFNIKTYVFFHKIYLWVLYDFHDT